MHNIRFHVAVDVALTHIDTDGDGIITRAEVKDASTGAVVLRHGVVFAPAIMGCMGGILFYLVIRYFICRRHNHAKAPGGRLNNLEDPVPAAPNRFERRKRVHVMR